MPLVKYKFFKTLSIEKFNHEKIIKNIFLSLFLFCVLFSSITQFNIYKTKAKQSQLLLEDNFHIKEIDQKLPIPIVSSSISSNGSHFFVLGGTSDCWVGTDNVYCVDSQTFTFVKIATLPEPIYGTGSAQIGSKFYYFGGFHNGSKSNKIHCFDIETYEFENISTTLPYPLEDPTVVSYGDESIYVIDGIGPELLIFTGIIHFNIKTNEITSLPISFPDSIFQKKASIIDDSIYIFGGRNIETMEFIDTIWRYDIVKGSLEELEFSLPKSFNVYSFLTVDNKIIIFSYYSDEGHVNELMIIDPLNEINLEFSGSIFGDSTKIFKSVCYDDYYIYIFGTVDVTNIPWADNGIYRIKIKTNIGNNNKIEYDFTEEEWEAGSQDSFTTIKDDKIEWNFDDNLNYMKINLEHQYHLAEKDMLDLEIGYNNHSDINSRQSISIGWCDKVNTSIINKVPDTSFIGFYIRNNVINQEYLVNIVSYVVKDDVILSIKRFYLNKSISHNIRMQIYVFNVSHFFQTITIDGTVKFNQFYEGDLTDTVTNNFALWNRPASLLETQGYFNGNVTFIRYCQNVDYPHTKNWYITSELFKALNTENKSLNSNPFIEFLTIIFIILILTSLTIFTLFNKQIRFNLKSESEFGIPKAIVPSTMYAYYMKLKDVFIRIDAITNGLKVNKEEKILDVKQKELSLSKIFINWQNEELEPIGVESFQGLSSTSFKILLYLLEHLDRGTYSSAIEYDLGLLKSTLSYNIKLLEEKKLVTRDKSTILDDQRFKIVIINENGVKLLYRIYKRLDEIFLKEKQK